MTVRSKKGIQKRIFVTKNQLCYFSSKNVHNLTNKSGRNKLHFGIKKYVTQKRLKDNYTFLI